MKLRNFIPTDRKLPPTNLYVLGYWESEPGPFVVIRRNEDGIWLSSDSDADDFVPPLSWSRLPGGDDLNTASLLFDFKPELDTEV